MLPLHMYQLSPSPIRRSKPFAAALMVLLMLFSGGCGPSSAPHTDSGETSSEAAPLLTGPLTLALNWYAEAEHGGYIAAKELGYYQKHGLDVVIQPGGPGAPVLVVQELAAGRIPFAVSSADLVVLARSQGVDLVAVAAPLQQSPRCILVHQDSGIERLEDLRDVELAISETRPFALWMKKQLPLTNVRMIPYSGLVGEFLQRSDFAQQGFVFSEPFVARENGGNPRVLMVSDIGFNPYDSVLVTTKRMIQQQPDLVRKIVQASVQGWQSYLDDPRPVNERIHAANAEMSLKALAFGAEAMKPLCRTTDGIPLCGMTSDRWETLVSQIESLGEIASGSVRAADCFDVSFLADAEPNTDEHETSDNGESADTVPSPKSAP
ncbi:MAG: ABC transporter substrate-binding protein [Planctomycetaceae bacterium]|nr:ABC transporter substrate-binding protein [Planctomycetaceae bacterium]